MRYVVGVMSLAKARRKDIENALLGELIASREWILLTGGRDVAQFFTRLGRRLVTAVETPEEAVNLIMKRFERRGHSLMEGAQSWGTI
jgi:hypothetical protein